MGHELESIQKETEMKRLASRKAVVTGAMQGIGAGISRVLASHGAEVVLTDISEKVEETASSIDSATSGILIS